MPLPPLNEIKASALQLFADGKERRVSEAADALAPVYNLTAEEQSDPLPTKNKTRWKNRVYWACFELTRAGLLEKSKPSYYLVTAVGRTEAAKKPSTIDGKYLSQFPQWQKYLADLAEKKKTQPAVSHLENPSPDLPPPEDSQDEAPEETIKAGYEKWKVAFQDELLDRVRKMDPVRFEQLVKDLLLKMGYGEEAALTKLSHDEGIDVIINKDALGLEKIFVQVKRWQQNVGRVDIQNFVGALSGKRANGGLFIATGGFSSTALQYVGTIPQNVILVDGEQLADLMIKHNIGVSAGFTYELKRIDKDFFELE